MAVVIGLLRGVNVGGNRLIRMDALRDLCGSLNLREACTHLQSGNVVFKTPDRSIATVAAKLEKEIERAFGFHSDVILRTSVDLKAIIANNPFEGRAIEPARLLVYFLARDPGAEARAAVSKIDSGPEELHVAGRELYIHFVNGLARPKLSMAALDRALKTPATGRNWNTVVKLLEIAERLERT